MGFFGLGVEGRGAPVGPRGLSAGGAFAFVLAGLLQLLEVLLFVAAHLPAVDPVPDLVQFLKVALADVELLIVLQAGVDPDVDVRVVGVAVDRSHGPRLRHRLVEELACHLQRAGRVDLAFERDHGAVVRPGLPSSASVPGALDVLPHLGIGVELSPQFSIPALASGLLDLFGHVLQQHALLAVLDGLLARDVVDVGCRRAAGPGCDLDESPACHRLPAPPGFRLERLHDGPASLLDGGACRLDVLGSDDVAGVHRAGELVDVLTDALNLIQERRQGLLVVLRPKLVAGPERGEVAADREPGPLCLTAYDLSLIASGSDFEIDAIGGGCHRKTTGSITTDLAEQGQRGATQWVHFANPALPFSTSTGDEYNPPRWPVKRPPCILSKSSENRNRIVARGASHHRCGRQISSAERAGATGQDRRDTLLTAAGVG